MKKILAVLLILCCALPATAKKRQNEEIITPLTQLEKRQFQTKTYQAQDSLLAMKALLNVLQDDGFIVYNVNSMLGYIYGVKDFDISDPNIDISKEFGVTKSRLNYNGVKVATLEVSANVTQYGDKSRVRVNFKRKLLNEYGNAQMIDDIEDAQYYEEFYTKVDSAIALQKQFIQKSQAETSVNVKKPMSKPKPIIKKPEPVKEIQQDDQTNIQNSEQPPKIEEENENQEVVAEPIKIENSSESEQIPEEIKTSAQEVKDNQPKEETVEYKKDEKKQSKELKEALKQAKEETKQARKEAKQAQKEALEAEKQAQKEAKRQAKENKE